MSRSTPLHLPLSSALTFGVELELLIAAIPLEYSDSHPLPKHTRYKKPMNPFPNDPHQVSGILDYPHSDFQYDSTNINSIGSKIDQEYAAYTTCIADSLKAIGVPATPFYHFPPYVQDSVADASGVKQTWEVKRDTSVYARFLEDDPMSFYKWQSVELASPVFYTIEEAFEEIRKVCLHLTTQYRVMTNSTCGLHIHVGNCSSGFDLPTLKRLMANLWTYEPQIHTLHPHERTSGISGYVFSKPLRYNGAHQPHQPEVANFADPYRPTNLEALTLVHKCKTKEELIYWLSNPAGYNAYKLENLLPIINKNFQTIEEAEEQLTTSKRTIEFRQHIGTLDPYRIISWARLAIGLVDKARFMDPDKALRKVLHQMDIEEAHPTEAWGRGLETMLRDAGGKEIEDLYLGWLGNEKEWLAEQLVKRKLEEDSQAESPTQHGEEENEGKFQAAMSELQTLDKRLAKLEAEHLSKKEKRLARLDEEVMEVKEKTCGRRTGPKPCTSTTSLSHGSAISKMKLLSRAAGGRFVGSRRL